MSRVAGFELADDLGPTRDGQIVDIALRGGFVEWPWAPVPLEDGRGYFEVAIDYFALGSASGEWVRTPMGGAAAQAIANLLNACLPTAFMVDLIWRHGNVKLTPQPYQNLSGMTRTERFAEHHQLIEKQRQERSGLIVGCKKDLVVSNRLVQYPEAVCIYGWHQPDGNPIQPVSTAHRQWWYADYSHGIRFVRRTMMLDGQAVDVHDVMRDPRRAQVLTGGQDYAQLRRQDDAVLRVVEYPTEFYTDQSFDGADGSSSGWQQNRRGSAGLISPTACPPLGSHLPGSLIAHFADIAASGSGIFAE